MDDVTKTLLTILGAGISAILVALLRHWLRSRESPRSNNVIHTENYYINHPLQPIEKPPKIKKVSNNIAVSTVQHTEPEVFNLSEFIEPPQAQNSEATKRAKARSNGLAIAGIPSDLTRPFSLGSLGQTGFSFDPSNTKVTYLGGGAGMVSDAEKLFISKPQEGLKIGIYNPQGLDTLVQETDDEFIIRLRKKNSGTTVFSHAPIKLKY